MEGNGQLAQLIESTELEVVGKRRLFKPRVRDSELSELIASLGAMIDAGIPIVDALDVVREQSPNAYLRDILLVSRKMVENGKPLNAALGYFPDVFDQVSLAIIRAGELSGTVDNACNNISTDIDAKSNLRQKIIALAMYPFFVLVVLFGVLGFMLVSVVPKMADIYRDVGQDLPIMTQIIIWLSDFVVSPRFLIIIAIVFAAIIFFVVLLRIPRFKFAFHNAQLSLPLISPLLKEINLVRFSRTLSLVLSSGLPILEAINVVANTLGNIVYRKALLTVGKSIERGQSISQTIAKDKSLYPRLFSPTSVKVIAVGEKSGTLPESLGKLAEILDKRIERSVQLFYSFLEPVLLIVIALIVGGVVIAVTLPIYQLPNTISVQ